jgi:thioesterase domain-containing protein
LAAHLPPDQPIYGIKSRGQAGLEELSCLEEMATYYLREVQAVQPTGPYYLGGYCFGGNVAYEMARQLHAQGETVALLALLDSAPSNAGYESIPWWRPSYSVRFARNLSCWLSDFSELEPRVRLQFVARKTRAFGRKLLRRFWPNGEGDSVDIEEVIDPRHFTEHDLKLWEAHLRALVNHIQQPYAGDVTLFRTRGQPLFSSLADDFCWSPLVNGRVEVKLVPGSHENIFVEPNVQHLAKELAATLSVPTKQSTSGPAGTT